MMNKFHKAFLPRTHKTLPFSIPLFLNATSMIQAAEEVATPEPASLLSRWFLIPPPPTHPRTWAQAPQ